MDYALFFALVAFVLLVALQAGVLLLITRLFGLPFSIWVGWFAFFLLLAASRDVGSTMIRVFVSSSAASAVYQLQTVPCFRRKDFQQKKDQQQDDPESNKGV